MEKKNQPPTSDPAPLTEENVAQTAPAGSRLIIGLGGSGSSAMERLKFVLGKKNAEPPVFLSCLCVHQDDDTP